MPLEVSYNGQSIVTVSGEVGEGEDFDTLLSEAHSILARYHRSRPGSIWGCDGIGYHIQREKGHIAVHKSGVGSRKYKATQDAV